MKKIQLTALMGILVAALSALSLPAAGGEEEKPTASADIGFFSQYVWRGYELSKDSMVIQPSITVGYKGLSMNLWGNLDTRLDDQNPATSDKSELNETDWTLAYATQIGWVNLGAGFIYYGLDGLDDSQEFYLAAGLDVLLAPTLTVYREIAHLPGWYVRFGISHAFALPKGVTLDLAGSAGYYHSDDDSFVERDDNLRPTLEKYRNLHDGLLSIGLTIPLSKWVALKPSVSYSFPLSGDADNLISGSSPFSNDSDFFYAGIVMSAAF